MNHEWLVLAAIAYGLPLLAVIDMFRFRPATWHRARHDRTLWVTLAIVLGPLGALLYATGPRLVLRRTVRDVRADAPRARGREEPRARRR